MYRSDNADLISVLDYSRSNRGKYVLVTDCTMLFSSTFDDMILRHEASGADLTFLYTRMQPRRDAYHLVVDMDRKNNLRNVFVRPEKPVTNKVSMGVIVLGKALFEDWSVSPSPRGTRVDIYGLLMLHAIAVKGSRQGCTAHNMSPLFAVPCSLDRPKRQSAVLVRSAVTRNQRRSPALYATDSYATDAYIAVAAYGGGAARCCSGV